MQGWLLFLQSITVPLPQLRGSVVGALREIKKDFVRFFRSTHCIVRQYELVQLGLIESRVRTNFRLCESLRFWICVRIENGCRCDSVAGPKTQAAYLLRVSFPGNRVRQMWDSARMWRRWTARKTRHCQIKTAPEKMHGTAFATETRAKFLKHAIALHKDLPEPVGVLAIVRAVLFILIKRDRIFDLVRHHADLNWQFQIIQC